MNALIQRLRTYLYQDFTETMLRLIIILWCVATAILALTVKNKWLLAGILAWEVLP